MKLEEPAANLTIRWALRSSPFGARTSKANARFAWRMQGKIATQIRGMSELFQLKVDRMRF
jgi:hypothetical protein